MRRLPPCLLLLCLLAHGARADGGAAHAAFAAGDFPKAAALLQPLAAQGDGDAAWLLGQMAENGWGGPVSDNTAFAWYLKAGEGGKVDGLMRAALFAERGRGTPLDSRLAYDLYRRAAEAGSVPARGRMGEMAVIGRGRKVNVTEGLLWLRQAAVAGDPAARAWLEDLAARQPIAATLSPSPSPLR